MYDRTQFFLEIVQMCETHASKLWVFLTIVLHFKVLEQCFLTFLALVPLKILWNVFVPLDLSNKHLKNYI